MPNKQKLNITVVPSNQYRAPRIYKFGLTLTLIRYIAIYKYVDVNRHTKT